METGNDSAKEGENDEEKTRGQTRIKRSKKRRQLRRKSSRQSTEEEKRRKVSICILLECLQRAGFQLIAKGWGEEQQQMVKLAYVHSEVVSSTISLPRSFHLELCIFFFHYPPFQHSRLVNAMVSRTTPLKLPRC